MTWVAQKLHVPPPFARSSGRLTSVREEQGDELCLGERTFSTPEGLAHIATTVIKAQEAETPEKRQAVADDLVAALGSFPSKTMIVGLIESEGPSTQAVVASPDEALTSPDTLGIYEFVQKLGSSPSIKEQAKAFPSSYHQVGPFDPEGKTDAVRLPGVHTLDSLHTALAEGGQLNNDEMIAELVNSLPEGERAIMLIGGPSSAGKSTLIRRLEELAPDRDLVKIEGDNYFMDVDDSRYPTRPDGTYYWDHYDVLDHELVKKNFQELITQGETMVPVYDFRAIHGTPEDWEYPFTGVRTGYQKVCLGHDDILVFDSLHATNSDLMEDFAAQGLPVVAVYLDTPSSNDRLVRRIVRDYHHRGGQTPAQTLAIWDGSVRPGEVDFVRPSMKALDVSRDVFSLSHFEAEPRLNRAQIEARSQALADYGLMPEYETYKLRPDQIPAFARSEEIRFQAVLAKAEADQAEINKARKGLALIRSAPKYQGEIS